MGTGKEKPQVQLGSAGVRAPRWPFRGAPRREEGGRPPTLPRVVLDQELPGEDTALAPALGPCCGGSGQVFS